MSSPTLFAHVFAERRRVLVVLASLLVVNVLAFGLVVYPMSQRVANVEERDRSAEATLTAARNERGLAQNTLNGKDRASTALATFYKDVLPASLSGARKLTYPRLEQIATKSGLTVRNYRFETIPLHESSLTRAKVEMALTGSYEAMRVFVHQLETAPEFVVIDDVGLAEGTDVSKDLALTLQLSTYFRGGTQ